MFTLRGWLRSNKSTIVRTIDQAVAPPGYPWAVARPVALADGAELRLRAIRPDDQPRLRELFHRLSRQSVYNRFFRVYDRLPDDWYHRFAHVDYRARLALVAEEADAGALRGVVRWEPGPVAGVVEIAIVVEDAWQGRGLGGLLLDALLRAAEARGIRRFTADVLADNRPMLRLITRLGEVLHRELEAGVLTIEFARRALDHRRLA
jgi:RimJ/RimL family protein N-acetyltransferase